MVLLSAAALGFANPGAAPQEAGHVCLMGTLSVPAWLFQCSRKGALPVGLRGPPGPPREPDSRRILFPNFILTNAAAFDCF